MSSASRETTAVATPSCGPLEGKRVSDNLVVFTGVPYAEPPVGDRRWRAPAVLKPWSKTRPALTPGPYCPQYDIDNVGLFATVPMSEDCLYLNIWTPALDGRRPVLFYIHGGGFEAGSGSAPPYSGQWLATQNDSVVVTINYRLSIFGLPPFEAYGDAESTNLGLLDQVEALRWVRDNIAAFGGDPNSVTLFGLSAGGWSIVSLLGMKQAQGLFHKAVAQSASALSTLAEETRAVAVDAIVKHMGMQGIDWRLLLAASTEDLLGAAKAAHLGWRGQMSALGDRYRAFIPHREEQTLAKSPMDMAAAPGAFKGPLLIGTTREEVGYNPFRAAVPTMKSYFRRADTVAALAHTMDRERAEHLWDAYERLRGQSEAQIGGVVRSAYDYIMPAIRFAEARATEAPTWMYQFTYAPPKTAGATHAADILFWAGSLEGHSPLSTFLFGESGVGDEERNLSRMMRDDLVGLARSGTLDWAKYDTAHRTTRIYDIHPRIVSDPAGQERAIWDGVKL